MITKEIKNIICTMMMYVETFLRPQHGTTPVTVLFVLRFYGPVNPVGSCRARSVYLTTRLLGRFSPLSGLTSIVHMEVKLKSKRLPLETKNTKYSGNRRLDFIKSLHMQQCNLRGSIQPLAPA